MMADPAAATGTRPLISSTINLDIDPPIAIDLDLDESTRTENTNSIDATLDLRRNYQNTIDCLIHCEHIINDLTSQLTQKDELIASLEERLVEMSLELASSKAFEDEYRSKRRMSNMDIAAAADDGEHEESGCCSDVGSDKSGRSSTDRSNSSSGSNKSTRRRPRFRRASCADEDEPAHQSVEAAAAAAGIFRRRSRFGRTPSRDSASNPTEKPPRASSLDMMEHKKKSSKSTSCKSSNHDGHGRPKHRRASCTDMTSDDHHTTTTHTTPLVMKPSWRWSNDNNEDEAFLDDSSKTDLTAPLDESCCSSSNHRNMNMSYSLGQFFRSKHSNSRTSGDNHNLTMEEGENEEQSNSESISSSHPQDRRSAAREEERKNSSRSVLDGVVFPLSEEDVDRYVGI